MLCIRPIAAARTSTARMCSRAGLPGVGASRTAGSIARLLQLPTPGRANPRGLAIGAVVPLRHARQGADAVLDPERSTACRCGTSTIARLMDLYAETDPVLAGLRRGHGDQPRRRCRMPQRPGRPACTRDQPAEPASIASSPRPPKPPPSSCPRRWPAHRRAQLQRLGHARQRGPREGQLALRLGGLDAAIRCATDRHGHSVERHHRGSSSPSSAAPRRLTAPRAPTTAWPRSRLWSAARSRAAAFSRTGPACAKPPSYEGRDLAPTRDLRAVLKGVLRDHLGIPDGALAGGIFPESVAARPLDGLVA